ncbi:MAG: HEAT repeat domain-containing protein [Elusimicrobia bacterium]|nr:HEAT repeat domain-containing protein [Elusimicrobiota bacterium]
MKSAILKGFMAQGWTLFCARARILLVAVGISAGLRVLPCAAQESVADAIKALRSTDLQARAQARETLVKAGPSAVPEMVASLRDQRRRLILLAVMGQMGRPVMPRLLDLLKDPVVRPLAGEALVQLVRPDYGMSMTLAKCLSDPDLKHYCGPAFVKVADGQAKAYFPELLRALKSRDQDVRMYAATALGQAGPGAAAAAQDLAAALADPAPIVRLAAARALGRIGPGAGKAKPALEAAVKDQDPEVGREAAKALRGIRRASKRQAKR